MAIKKNGKEFTIKHLYDEDDKYGKFIVKENGKQVKVVDYGEGHKFHGYNFDKERKAYAKIKEFLDIKSK